MLIKEWKTKVNLLNHSASFIAASVANVFLASGTPLRSRSEFLPFELPRRYMTTAEAVGMFKLMKPKWDGANGTS